MSIRTFIAAAVVSIATIPLFALSPEHEAWRNSAVHFFFTDEEAAAWNGLRTDHEAQAFIDLFWARRDPTPATPRNEFREQFEARLRYADENFAAPDQKRGSMSDRGRVFILFGAPVRASRASEPQPGGDEQATATGVGTAVLQTWTYEGEDAKKFFNAPRAEIRFVDRQGRGDYRLAVGGANIPAAQRRAAAAAITQPNLTAAPAAAAAATAAAPERPAVQTELAAESLRAAVADFRKSGRSDNAAHVAWGEFVTVGGQTFAPVLLYLPKGAGVSASKPVTFFGVVESADGTPLLAFEQPATLTPSRDDFFVDRSLIGLPAGKHRGIFGIAEEGKVIALASAEMELAGTLDPAGTAVSRLILSNNVYPLAAAQAPTDPFAFGGLKVVPKADSRFRKTDELWYFVELRHPGLAEAALPEGQVRVNGDAAPQTPKIQLKLDVTGKDFEGKPVKMTAPPREADAIEMKGVPGHYGVGSAIPLSGFKPGDYVFTVKVIDTIRKTSHTLTEPFKVVE